MMRGEQTLICSITCVDGRVALPSFARLRVPGFSTYFGFETILCRANCWISQLAQHGESVTRSNTHTCQKSETLQRLFATLSNTMATGPNLKSQPPTQD